MLLKTVDPAGFEPASSISF